MGTSPVSSSAASAPRLGSLGQESVQAGEAVSSEPVQVEAVRSEPAQACA